jgi:hypothetical protein
MSTAGHARAAAHLRANASEVFPQRAQLFAGKQFKQVQELVIGGLDKEFDDDS